MFNSCLYNEAVPGITVLPSPDHIMAAGNYRFVNRAANRIVIIGREPNDDLVFGEISDHSDEMFSGERLNFRLAAMLGNQADALVAAEAAEAGLRRQMVRGLVSGPPHCGAELYDVVKVTDYSLPFQGGVNYRISGIFNKYDSRSGNFIQALELSGV
jgi:hypothetical protein